MHWSDLSADGVLGFSGTLLGSFIALFGIACQIKHLEKIRKDDEIKKEREKQEGASAYFQYLLILYKKYLDYYLKNKIMVKNLLSFYSSNKNIRYKLYENKELFHHFFKNVSEKEWSVKILNLMNKLESIENSFKTLDNISYNSEDMLSPLETLGFNLSNIKIIDKKILQEKDFSKILELNESLCSELKKILAEADKRIKLLPNNNRKDFKIAIQAVYLFLDSRDGIYGMFVENDYHDNSFNFYKMYDEIIKIETKLKQSSILLDE